jgi:hypothetical protein
MKSSKYLVAAVQIISKLMHGIEPKYQAAQAYLTYKITEYSACLVTTAKKGTKVTKRGHWAV